MIPGGKTAQKKTLDQGYKMKPSEILKKEKEQKTYDKSIGYVPGSEDHWRKHKYGAKKNIKKSDATTPKEIDETKLIPGSEYTGPKSPAEVSARQEREKGPKEYDSWKPKTTFHLKKKQELAELSGQIKTAFVKGALPKVRDKMAKGNKVGAAKTAARLHKVLTEPIQPVAEGPELAARIALKKPIGDQYRDYKQWAREASMRGYDLKQAPKGKVIAFIDDDEPKETGVWDSTYDGSGIGCFFVESATNELINITRLSGIKKGK